ILTEYDGRVYPGLAISAVAAAKGAVGLALRIANVNTVTLSLGDQILPLDGKSNLLLRYRRKKKTFPYISAADVLGNDLPPDTFRNKVALVGATALGTRDVVATPFDTVFTGIEVQATVADNLLRQDPIRRTESAAALEAQTALFAGVALTLLVGRAGLFWGSLGGLMGLTFLWSAPFAPHAAIRPAAGRAAGAASDVPRLSHAAAHRAAGGARAAPRYRQSRRARSPAEQAGRAHGGGAQGDEQASRARLRGDRPRG